MSTQCSCPSQLTTLSQMCPACQADWEDWMESTAMPELRAAVARMDEPACWSEAKTQAEEAALTKCPNASSNFREEVCDAA